MKRVVWPPELGFTPGGAAQPAASPPWDYDRRLYRQRNEIERLFRRLKGFRRVFYRFDKLDALSGSFVFAALVVL